MNPLEQLRYDINILAQCIRDLSCLVNEGSDPWIKDRLILIHDNARDILHRS